MIKLTQLNGTPIYIQLRAIVAVRAPFPGEYEEGCRCVISTGTNHGVTESLDWVVQKLGGPAV